MKHKTERIKLSEITLDDLANIHQLHSLPQTDEFNTLGIPGSIQTTEHLLKEWIEKRKQIPPAVYVFKLELAESNTFIGIMGIKMGKPNYKIAEAWYKLHPDYWRQGYATEALFWLLNFSFRTLGLHRIEAGCAVDNIASIRVLEKVGMISEGRKRKILPIRGEWVDNYFYAILDTDFRCKDPEP